MLTASYVDRRNAQQFSLLIGLPFQHYHIRAHHDYYAERISVQTYRTFRAFDHQSCLWYLADFAKRSKNPRCYEWCGSLSHWTRKQRRYEGDRCPARSYRILPSRFLPDRYRPRFVNFPRGFDRREDAEGSSYWLGYVLMFIAYNASALANFVNCRI
jgi:hypothetical protein